MIFYDRKEAGEKLAKLLLNKYKGESVVVYGLPRGGVVTGIEVSKKLNSPFDLIITRKIGHPFEKEYAIAAVSEDGYVSKNKEELERADNNWFENEIKKERLEIKRRRKLYLKDKEKISAINKTAIIVDDGIATGLTMKAAIEDVKNRNPKKIVVAIPVIPESVKNELSFLVDEVIALDYGEEYLGSVGAYYKNFPQITDDMVIELMSKIKS